LIPIYYRIHIFRPEASAFDLARQKPATRRWKNPRGIRNFILISMTGSGASPAMRAQRIKARDRNGTRDTDRRFVRFLDGNVSRRL
jgi:hypothetical protein